MKIVNASAGKVGSYQIGPKYYLKENIYLGQLAICITRDSKQPTQPFVWLIGGIDQLVDYISLAKSKGVLDTVTCDLVLGKLDEAKTKMPKTAYERLASVLGMDESELKEMIELSQVCVSAPIAGVQDYSDKTPKWIPKSLSYAPVH